MNFHYYLYHFYPPIYAGSLRLMFPHQNPIYTSPLPYTCYMHLPTHSSLFDHLNNIWCRVQIIKLPLCSSHHSPVTSSLLGQMFSSAPSSQISSAYFLPQCERPSFIYTYVGPMYCIVLYCIVLYCIMLLCYVILCLLYYIILYYIILYYIILYYIWYLFLCTHKIISQKRFYSE